MKKEERLSLGTIVYLDGIEQHLGMIGGYTIDEYCEPAYLMAATIIDGRFAWNDEGEDDIFTYPVEICFEAAQEDAQKFYNEIMNK